MPIRHASWDTQIARSSALSSVRLSLHLHPCPNGPERVVLVDHGDSEHGHHLVAPEPLDGAAMRSEISVIDCA